MLALIQSGLFDLGDLVIATGNTLETEITNDADGIGGWLNGNLRILGILTLLATIILTAFKIAKGERAGLFRTLAPAFAIVALMLNPNLLGNIADLVAAIMERVVNTFDAE